MRNVNKKPVNSLVKGDWRLTMVYSLLGMIVSGLKS